MKSLSKIDAQSCEHELSKFKYTFALIVSTLREIFDESAYDRFLHRSQLAPSRGAYAAFRKEYEVSKGSPAALLLSNVSPGFSWPGPISDTVHRQLPTDYPTELV